MIYVFFKSHYWPFFLYCDNNIKIYSICHLKNVHDQEQFMNEFMQFAFPIFVLMSSVRRIFITETD